MLQASGLFLFPVSSFPVDVLNFFLIPVVVFLLFLIVNSLLFFLTVGVGLAPGGIALDQVRQPACRTWSGWQAACRTNLVRLVACPTKFFCAIGSPSHQILLVRQAHVALNFCDRRLSHQHTIALKLFCRTKLSWLYFTLLESCQIGVGSRWIQLYLIGVHFYHSSSSFASNDSRVQGCVWFDKEGEEKLCLVW